MNNRPACEPVPPSTILVDRRLALLPAEGRASKTAEVEMRLRFLICAFLVGAGMSIAVAQSIPAGTVLPVMLSSTLDLRHDKPGRVIAGKIMQDVRLPDGQTI